jgi:twitching motility two-component system response regulator PilH
MKALVIDDSRFQRIAIQRALGRAGHDVITAEDGEAGLKTAQQAVPDIIVLDMMLPKLSGVDVLKALRQQQSTKEVPVIVLTALSEKNREKLLAEGATEFLNKSDVVSDSKCSILIAAMQQFGPGRK